jgi:diguanylate cyclase (GGDEF)-like protein
MTVVSSALYIALVIALTALVVIEQRRVRSAASHLSSLEQRLASQERALSEASERDSLTGLPNRLAFYEQLEADLSDAMREGQPLSCVLIDLDNLRRINDRFGHHFGDRVLQRFTRLLVRVLRSDDTVCRYGGDEFILILHQTAARQALTVAERVRAQMKREVFSDGHSAAAVTASFGIAAVPVVGVERANDLIERVEAAVVEAKRGGRDRIAADPAAIAATLGDDRVDERGPRPARRWTDEREGREG